MKYMLTMLASIAFASSAWADDFAIMLTNADSTNTLPTLQETAWVSIIPNQDHRFIVFGPETPTRSCYITPLPTRATTWKNNTQPKLGTMTLTGGNPGGKGGQKWGNGAGRVIFQETLVSEDGVAMLHTVTQNWNGVTVNVAPIANGVLEEQQAQTDSPMGGGEPNCTMVITQNGGPLNGRETFYTFPVPFLSTGIVNVVRTTDSVGRNSYRVINYSATFSTGASIQCSSAGLSINLNWWKEADEKGH